VYSYLSCMVYCIMIKLVGFVLDSLLLLIRFVENFELFKKYS